MTPQSALAEKALSHIDKTRIIAILRGNLRGREIEIVEPLVENGITAIEVSSVSPGYLTSIRHLSEHFKANAAIGAGTILRLDQLQSAYEAGAAFIVSPNCVQQVIAQTKYLGMASFPGAYTPTEIVAAAEWGADAVKVFPAVSLGPAFFRALRGPLPDIKFVPTGGIELSNMNDYFSAGVYAVGIGSELVSHVDILASDSAALANKAAAFSQMAKVSQHV